MLDSLPASERQARFVEAASRRRSGHLSKSGPGGRERVHCRIHQEISRRQRASGTIPGASIIARVETEARAGKLAADVIKSGELGILVLIDRGVMARYRSPQLRLIRNRIETRMGLVERESIERARAGLQHPIGEQGRCAAASRRSPPAALEGQDGDGQPILLLVWRADAVPG